MRNRCMRCCCMNNNFVNMHNKCNDSNLIENCCNNTGNLVQSYNDNCGCGFDDNYMDVFPDNPNLAQSYVPTQFMNETFKPCVRFKTRNNFSRTCKPLFSL